MPFFHESQNNSGGYFDFDKKAGITHHIVIEAKDAKHANKRFNNLIDSYNCSPDCPCCGDRWNGWWSDEYGGNETPMVYGKPVTEFEKEEGIFNWMGDDPSIAVHYRDGKFKWFGKK